MARADIRIKLEHYPDIDTLSHQIVHPESIPENQIPLHEQLVSLVIDNVSGKHYERIPKWLRAEVDKDDEGIKWLRCTEKPDIAQNESDKKSDKK